MDIKMGTRTAGLLIICNFTYSLLGENARFLKKNFMISKDKATTTASVGMRMVAARV